MKVTLSAREWSQIFPELYDEADAQLAEIASDDAPSPDTNIELEIEDWYGFQDTYHLLFDEEYSGEEA